MSSRRWRLPFGLICITGKLLPLLGSENNSIPPGMKIEDGIVLKARDYDAAHLFKDDAISWMEAVSSNITTLAAVEILRARAH